MPRKLCRLLREVSSRTQRFPNGLGHRISHTVQDCFLCPSNQFSIHMLIGTSVRYPGNDCAFDSSWICSSPSTNFAPVTTLASSSEPLSRRQCFWASRPSLKTMVSVAIRDPHPLVRWVRSRTVAKVDSMGLVVLRWDQCWAGKSSMKHSH